METQNSTKTGHRALDYTELFSQPDEIPIVFLSKSSASLRDDFKQRLQDGNGEPWPGDVPQRPLAIIPWLRTFTPTRHVIPQIHADMPVRVTEHILVDQDLLDESKCIIAHRFIDPKDRSKTQECAIVPITDAYRLLSDRPRSESWFTPGPLDPECRFDPDPEHEFTAEPEEDEEAPVAPDLVVLIPSNCAKEQEEQLQDLFSTDWEFIDFDSDFVRVPIAYVDDPSLDAAATQDRNMDNVMQYFLAKGWFPRDFILVDAQALSRLPVKKKDLPNFLYATNLMIWHGFDERTTIAHDQLGYAVGRLKMHCKEAYSYWMGAYVKGLGLGRYVGKGEREDYKLYYWSCWKDEEGNVDEDVRPYFSYD
jgi:hypothetical protein